MVHKRFCQGLLAYGAFYYTSAETIYRYSIDIRDQMKVQAELNKAAHSVGT